MQAIINWFNKPYPFDGNWSRNFAQAAWAGLFVMLFLLVFKPFGTQIPAEYFWFYARVCFYFGLVTFGVLLLSALVMRALPGFFREEGWCIWKEILSSLAIISLIGYGNLIFAHFFYGQPLTGQVVWFWQKATFLIGLFPVLFMAYTKQHLLQKKFSAAAESLNVKIESHQPPAGPPAGTGPAITLSGDNQNETLTLPAGQILYLEAADNYVRVFYQQENSTGSTLLRSTLKNMEAQLSGHPQFFRCHRTFLVNLDRVVHVSGNAQGYKLHLEGCEITIPVSRSLNEEVNRRIK